MIIKLFQMTIVYQFHCRNIPMIIILFQLFYFKFLIELKLNFIKIENSLLYFRIIFDFIILFWGFFLSLI